ncbi:hypothetical protein PAECIP111890_02644 [Paenibacillus sp. JJ-223]|nr:hypothetical protein PAECIP111890_02644 [Paenibacillus sp. JJ-223]
MQKLSFCPAYALEESSTKEETFAPAYLSDLQQYRFPSLGALFRKRIRNVIIPFWHDQTQFILGKVKLGVRSTIFDLWIGLQEDLF